MFKKIAKILSLNITTFTLFVSASIKDFYLETILNIQNSFSILFKEINK